MRRLCPPLLVVLSATFACSDTPATSPPPPAKPAVAAVLRADANRDGDVRFDDTDANKPAWSAASGAVFMANIDDDTARCPKKGNDIDLDKCNDATDAVINGADDMLDLARLKVKPWATAPDGATALISVSDAAVGHVRLFKRTGPGEADFEPLADDGALTLDDLRLGAELAIEGLDIVRDSAVWDGTASIGLTVTSGADTASDSVVMRVAPVMTYHHLLPAEEVFVTNNGDTGNTAMRADLAAECKDVGLPPPTQVEPGDGDQWTQDFFETAFMSMPAAGGAQHVVRVNLRSANVFQPTSAKNPLRSAGQVVFTRFRGKDSAAVQQYDVKHSQDMDSLNSFGNTETIPPYALGADTFPLGRILRGATPTFYPDPTFTTMLKSQSVQPIVEIDTSWLYVGHVDETISFIKAATPRGWAMLVNDAALAKKMLDDQVAAGKGDTPMFVGMSWYDNNGNPTPADTTIAKVLADTTVMGASADAAIEVAGQIKKLKDATGITDSEIIGIPFLHTTTQGLSYAYTPGTVNGIYIADARFVTPNPHGPMINGKDIFAQAVVDQLATIGVTAHFAEDWDEYHAQLGEVHCGTNTRRKVPAVKWWETGR